MTGPLRLSLSYLAVLYISPGLWSRDMWGYNKIFKNINKYIYILSILYILINIKENQ